MHPKTLALVSFAAIALAAAGCGGGSSSSTTSQPTTPGFFITISNFSFSPLDLRVPAGATVTVLNRDGVQHDVTSEATAGAFTPGEVAGVAFETGPFTGNMSFTIPSGVPNGTVVPYFCNIHKATMNTPTATITIESSAQPAMPPGSGSGGGGMGGY